MKHPVIKAVYEIVGRFIVDVHELYERGDLLRGCQTDRRLSTGVMGYLGNLNQP